MPNLKAEFRKVFTVRSTYGVLAFVLLLLGIFAFYAQGIRAESIVGTNPGLLASGITQATTATTLFVSIVAALLICHEYRYNTIMYTLATSKSRLRVLLSKVVVITVFSLITTLVIGFLSPLFTYLGLSLHGVHLVHQSIPYGTLVWHILFLGWGYSMVALLIGTLVRNMVGTIVTMFLFQSTVEPLLSLVLKHNAQYLPYRVLNAVLESGGNGLSPAKAAAVFSVYLIVGWVLAAVLFVKRDAN